MRADFYFLLFLVQGLSGHWDGPTPRSLGIRGCQVEDLRNSTENYVDSRCGKSLSEYERPERNNFTAPFFWVHVPKCGTSFENAMHHLGCPDLPTWSSRSFIRFHSKDQAGRFWNPKLPSCSQFCLCFPREVKSCNFWKEHDGARVSPGGHIPLSLPMRIAAHEKKLTILYVFREPIRRAYSNFVYICHQLKPNGGLVFNPDLHLCTSKAPEFSAFYHPHEMIYTKFLGVRPDQVQSALGLIQFVGVTELWESTICLFYAMFGTRTQFPSVFDFQNSRPTRQRDTDANNHSVIFENVEHGIRANLSNPPYSLPTADKKIYKQMRVRFWDDCQRYGIAGCAADLGLD